MIMPYTLTSGPVAQNRLRLGRLMPGRQCQSLARLGLRFLPDPAQILVGDARASPVRMLPDRAGKLPPKMNKAGWKMNIRE